MHQLELLPGLGKKHMNAIIQARDEKDFESFEDLKTRVKLIPDPEKTVMRRIMLELEGKEKVRLYGIVADHDDAIDLESELFIDGEKVGHITTPAYSRMLGKSIALVHLIPSSAKEGTRMEVKGPTIQCTATASPIPFYDPERKHLHAT